MRVSQQLSVFFVPSSTAATATHFAMSAFATATMPRKSDSLGTPSSSRPPLLTLTSCAAHCPDSIDALSLLLGVLLFSVFMARLVFTPSGSLRDFLRLIGKRWPLFVSIVNPIRIQAHTPYVLFHPPAAPIN